MSVKIDRGVVLRNTMLNIFGGLAPAAVSVATLPRVLSVLGAERYGILSLALVVVGYFAVLDLGLGQATTKFVAEALHGDKEKSLPSIVWTAVFSQLLLGILGGLLLAALTPPLVERWLNIPDAMHAEARGCMYLLCLAVPLMLVGPSLTGALEAAQRFDLANAVSIPAGAATAIVLYIGARLSWNLPQIMALLVATRLVIILCLLGLVVRQFPILATVVDVSKESFTRLLRYGSWFTAGGLVVPILMYLDRFMLGRYLSLSDVTYYTVPFGLLTRLLILPSSLARTLFPAFSALGAGDQEHLEDLYLRSFKYMLLVSGPVLLLLAALSSDIFTAWLGAETGAHCAPVLRALLYGAAFSMLAPIAATLLQGTGRPDVVVKWYLVCLPLNAIVVWFLVRTWGVAGAAASYALRAAAEALVFAVAAARVSKIPFSSLVKHRFWGLLSTLGVLFALMAAVPAAGGLKTRLAAYALGAAGFMLLSWSAMFDDADREFVKAQLELRVGAKLGSA